MNTPAFATATLAILVSSCAPSTAQDKPRQAESPAVPNYLTMTAKERGNFTHASVANSIVALRQVDAYIRKLPAKELATLQAAVRASIAECPYTHATFELLKAARDAVAAFPATAKKSDKRAAILAGVREAFTVQWRLCEALGVPAALAKSGFDTDEIVKAAKKTAVVNPNKIASFDVALHRVSDLLATVRARVDALPQKKKEGLQSAQRVMAERTAGLWNFKGIMIRCATDLQGAVGRGIPKAKGTGQPDAMLSQAAALLSVLRQHFALYC